MPQFWSCIGNDQFNIGCTGQTVYVYDKAGKELARFKELIELSRQIHALRSARNAKRVWLCKTWAVTRNKSEETVHIDDVDLPRFLAAAGTDCLYRIDLYQRYATGGKP